MNHFNQLGSLVERLWKQQNYDERVFPAIAMQALSELPPSEYVLFQEAVQFGLTDPLPEQADIEAEFGQPPLTVYSREHFRIEVLFWLHALPSIHQHGFSGAFHVMHGNTLHTTWKFQLRDRIATGLIFGDLKLQTAELMRQGDTCPIVAGSDFIHTTYHLQQPTVSVVVRTIKERDFLPQYTYLPPSVAFDPDELRPSIVRRRQLLAMLWSLGRSAECFDTLQHLLATSDSLAAFHYLLWANAAIGDSNLLHDIRVAANVKHARLMNELEPVLKYLRRQSRLEKIKNAVTDPDLQFFLGVLLNVPDREIMLSLLQAHCSYCDPVLFFAELADRLSKLGLLGFRFNQTWLFMLSCFMRGVFEEDAIQQSFMARYGDQEVSKNQEQISQIANSLTKFWLFEPYFEPSESTNMGAHHRLSTA